MKKKIITILCMLFSVQALAEPVTVGNKATATLASSCQITAQNVNFGQIILNSAGSAQSATSNMMLHCTKDTTYTVSLNSTYNANDYLVRGSAGDWYRVLNGVGCGGSYCYGNTIAPDGKPYYYPTSYNPASSGWIYDTSTKTYYAEGGVMTGSKSGDKIAYSIELPDNSGVNWDNTHLYSGKGIGSTQSIPIKATAKTGVRGPLYPTPDNYSTTVTAIINY